MTRKEKDKQAKRRILKHLKALLLMMNEDLLYNAKQIFPGMKGGERNELILMLMEDYLEDIIP